MLWDDEALYIAAELEEPHVWATLTKHDSVIFHDPDFEVFLDPDADSHIYGELELNALNTTWDLLLTKPYKDGGTAVNAWEITGLKTGGAHRRHAQRPAGHGLAAGRVEITWPWKGLKETGRSARSRRGTATSGGSTSRASSGTRRSSAAKYHKVPKRPEHNWVWSPQGVIDMHRPERWGYRAVQHREAGHGDVPPDPAQPARDYLHRVYYAQRDYHKQHGRYSNNLLGLGTGLGEYLTDPRLEATRGTFEATVELRRPDGRRDRWRITQDAHVGRE